MGWRRSCAVACALSSTVVAAAQTQFQSVDRYEVRVYFWPAFTGVYASYLTAANRDFEVKVGRHSDAIGLSVKPISDRAYELEVIATQNDSVELDHGLSRQRIHPAEFGKEIELSLEEPRTLLSVNGVLLTIDSIRVVVVPWITPDGDKLLR